MCRWLIWIVLGIVVLVLVGVLGFVLDVHVFLVDIRFVFEMIVLTDLVSIECGCYFVNYVVCCVGCHSWYNEFECGYCFNVLLVGGGN